MNTSMLEVADNSGAKKVQCIRVMGGANKRYASLGDTVIVAVKEAAPDGTVTCVIVTRDDDEFSGNNNCLDSMPKFAKVSIDAAGMNCIILPDNRATRSDAGGRSDSHVLRRR